MFNVANLILISPIIYKLVTIIIINSINAIIL